jgi:hypothetical protein
VYSTLHAAPCRSLNQSVDDRALIWGRGLLQLLQILRC